MNRAELQKLSNIRLREAQVLFAAGECSGAYDLAGYAVECGLKACYAKGVKRYDFPDKKGASKVFTHKLADLVALADLDTKLQADRRARPMFSSGWDFVRDWTEESRYSTWTKVDAEALIDTIIRRKDGVLPWFKRHW